MRITSESSGDLLELRVAGRLDNEWAPALAAAVDDAVRQGFHSVVLDLREVSYLSSAGISVLLRAHRQLQTIRGFFGVGSVGPHVEEVIRLTGLAKLLLCNIEKVRAAAAAGGAATLQPASRVSAYEGLVCELYAVDPRARLACRTFGEPGRLAREAFRAEDCQAVNFPARTFGLGLGAFGAGFRDCESRFGEFLAVAGGAAHQPSHNSGAPDFQLLTGDFVPQVQTLYGLQCTGDFAHLIRFEPDDDAGPVGLSALVEQSLASTETPVAGIAIAAETSGLIGAALRRSPVLAAAGGGSRLQYPEVRNWLSFTPERAFPRTLALIVGVAARSSALRQVGPLQPFLRRLGPHSDVWGHFHAAVFSYRPFKKRTIDLTETVASLFEAEHLQGVLHLLHDDREITGGGESEFLSGACWLSPLDLSVAGGKS